ncbi:MAG: hypothetical protein IKT79_02995, partial [Akkermansia sp.]|nr:hypothetical protein [Akkermansia sp.]
MNSAPHLNFTVSVYYTLQQFARVSKEKNGSTNALPFCKLQQICKSQDEYNGESRNVILDMPGEIDE